MRHAKFEIMVVTFDWQISNFLVIICVWHWLLFWASCWNYESQRAMIGFWLLISLCKWSSSYSLMTAYVIVIRAFLVMLFEWANLNSAGNNATKHQDMQACEAKYCWVSCLHSCNRKRWAHDWLCLMLLCVVVDVDVDVDNVWKKRKHFIVLLVAKCTR